ncbi:hypothetical protein [Sphingomicrobium sediminis]|uniref:Uncharacterized protein n=1 Tax=Sphingomicrobium sediminis TaxID=2950949 RepID=A0A9X2EIG9_9SPHN|nr:hypothetical protein [Sphingomicrobium sediminis]MCM8557371.1 hypothetical protein [Sphingomicrobium sediminis]
MSILIIASLMAVQEVPAPPPPPTPKYETEAEDATEVTVDVEELETMEAAPPPAAPPELSENPTEAERTAIAERVAKNCPTRGFEANFDRIEDGQARQTRVYLCAQSDDPADYRTMLLSARQRISIAEELTTASRAKLLSDIDREIAAVDGIVPQQGEQPGR